MVGRCRRADSIRQKTAAYAIASLNVILPLVTMNNTEIGLGGP